MKNAQTLNGGVPRMLSGCRTLRTTTEGMEGAWARNYVPATSNTGERYISETVRSSRRYCMQYCFVVMVPTGERLHRRPGRGWRYRHVCKMVRYNGRRTREEALRIAVQIRDRLLTANKR